MLKLRYVLGTSILSIIMMFVPVVGSVKEHPGFEPIQTALAEPLQASGLKQVGTLASVYVEPVKPPVKKATGTCSEWMTQAGIPHSAASDKLILNESGCNPKAINKSSGACGIPQALPCSKMKCPLNDSGAVCQLKWMDGYVKSRYGTWEKALATWYSRCGSKQGCWY